MLAFYMPARTGDYQGRFNGQREVNSSNQGQITLRSDPGLGGNDGLSPTVLPA